MPDFALTAPDPRDAKEKTVLQQVEEFVNANVKFHVAPHEVGHLIAKFIGTTKLGPTLNGEPVFVLRAQDRIAPFIVMKWADEAHAHDCPLPIVDGARKIAADMVVWQQTRNVKAPD